MTLRVGVSHGKSPSCLVRVHRSAASGDIKHFICLVTL